MQVDVSVQLGIPHITVLETLGRGGFGVVYKAFDSKMNRPVAVKVLTSIVDQSDLERFEQECRLHGPLSSHPSVVTVFDAGYTSNGSPYLVMELIEGGTLSDRLRRSGPAGWQQAVEWMIPICNAVQAAHERGVLHRDIKPSNVLLAPEGPKLADFGIACLSDATSPHFAVSWLHAAPESHENTRDARSDVYSLASTLHELLVGHAPFWREEQSLTSLMIRLIEEPPPHLPPPVAPRWLDDVLQRALSKNPAERPQTAAELAAALSGSRATANDASPLGFAAPILAGANDAPSQMVTQQRMMPANVRLETGSISGPGANSTNIAYGHANNSGPGANSTAAYGHANSGPGVHSNSGPGANSTAAYGHANSGPGVILVERPRRRRGGYVAAAIALAALAVSGLALSPAGADIFDRLAGAGTTPTTAPDATTTTPTTGGTSSVATTDGTGASTSSSTETSVTAPSTETTESTDASSTHTTPTTGTTATSEVTTTEPPIVEVPHLTGETVSDALATLDHLGFSNVTVAEESSESIAAGGVTRTNPAAGKDVDPDDHLTVYRSTGSATVTVPSVVGHSRQAAINTLQEAGFTVKTQFKTLESGSDDIGKVLSQNPSGGTAPANSEITILVGRAPLVIDNPGNTLITGLPPTTSGP